MKIIVLVILHVRIRVSTSGQPSRGIWMYPLQVYYIWFYGYESSLNWYWIFLLKSPISSKGPFFFNKLSKVLYKNQIKAIKALTEEGSHTHPLKKVIACNCCVGRIQSEQHVYTPTSSTGQYLGWNVFFSFLLNGVVSGVLF